MANPESRAEVLLEALSLALLSCNFLQERKAGVCRPSIVVCDILPCEQINNPRQTQHSVPKTLLKIRQVQTSVGNTFLHHSQIPKPISLMIPKGPLTQ